MRARSACIALLALGLAAQTAWAVTYTSPTYYLVNGSSAGCTVTMTVTAPVVSMTEITQPGQWGPVTVGYNVRYQGNATVAFSFGGWGYRVGGVITYNGQSYQGWGPQSWGQPGTQLTMPQLSGLSTATVVAKMSGVPFNLIPIPDPGPSLSLSIKKTFATGSPVTTTVTSGGNTGWLSDPNLASVKLTATTSSPIGPVTVKINSSDATSYTATSDGTYVLSVVARDDLGVTTTAVYTIKIDRSPPQSSISAQQPLDQWSNNKAGIWQPVFSDPHSGIASVTYKIGYAAAALPSLPTASAFDTTLPVTQTETVTATQPGTVPPLGPVGLTAPVPPDGYYYLLLTVTNGAGTTSSQVSGPFQYDATPPVAAAPTAAINADGATASVNWVEPQDPSGILSYGLTYAVGGGPPFPVTVSQNSGTISLTGLYGQTVTFTLTATDGAGNVSTGAVSTLAVPQQLSISVSNGTDSNDTTMFVEVDWGVAPSALGAYGSLSLSRTIAYPAGASSAPVALPPVPANVTTTSTPWRVSARGHAVFVDSLPTSSAAGGKLSTYMAAAMPAIPFLADSSSAVLPTHPGSLAFFRVLDLNGTEAGQPGFQVHSDGKVQVNFRAIDVDRNRLSYELNRVVQLNDASGNPSLISYKKLSGPSAIPYDPDTNGTYAEQFVPTTLQPGVNNLLLLWTEGPQNLVVRSDILSVLLAQSGGGYSITVTSGYQAPDTNSIGVVARPGERLTFQVGNPDSLDPNLFLWNFGDGSGVLAGTSVDHVYGQLPEQTASSWNPTVQLTLPDSNTLSLAVTVQDTQEGMLLQSETWAGDHVITGVVTVPAGLTLSIGGNLTVEMQGGLGAGFGQGLDILGNLVVGNGATFRPASGQGGGWGSIFVRGSASFGAGDLQGAEQGVVVFSGGNLLLNGTRLHGNQTGLHVIGDGVASPVVTVVNASIDANALYGIKEDLGGRPLLSGTTVSGNFRNYYSFDQGLLTISQINALNAQAATPNSGDTTRGTDE